MQHDLHPLGSASRPFPEWLNSLNPARDHSTGWATCFSRWQGQAEGQVMTSMSSPECGSSRRDKGGQTGGHASDGCAVILIKHLQCNPSWVSSTPTFATPENLIISQNIYYQVLNVTSLCQPLLWRVCFVKFCIILTNVQSWCLNSFSFVSHLL